MDDAPAGHASRSACPSSGFAVMQKDREPQTQGARQTDRDSPVSAETPARGGSWPGLLLLLSCHGISDEVEKAAHVHLQVGIIAEIEEVQLRITGRLGQVMVRRVRMQQEGHLQRVRVRGRRWPSASGRPERGEGRELGRGQHVGVRRGSLHGGGGGGEHSAVGREEVGELLWGRGQGHLGKRCHLRDLLYSEGRGHGRAREVEDGPVGVERGQRPRCRRRGASAGAKAGALRQGGRERARDCGWRVLAPVVLALELVPSVLHGRGGAAGERLCDGSPGCAQFTHLRLQELVLPCRPWLLAHARLEVVVPPLAALPVLARSHGGGDLLPVLGAVLGDSLGEDLVFSGAPEAAAALGW
mmetsp:Transcript_6546/g.16056  ORF Transcript_6546/g.16056 Transcript_6546/m.16056 type:complete len:357 (-) Transcript_6546:113-1183(-)